MEKPIKRIDGILNIDLLSVGSSFTFTTENDEMRISSPIVRINLNNGVGYIETINSIYCIGIEVNEIKRENLTEQYVRECARKVADTILKSTKKITLVGNINMDNITTCCKDSNWYPCLVEDIKPGWDIKVPCAILDFKTGCERRTVILGPLKLTSFTFDIKTETLFEFSTEDNIFITKEVLQVIEEIKKEKCCAHMKTMKLQATKRVAF